MAQGQEGGTAIRPIRREQPHDVLASADADTRSRLHSSFTLMDGRRAQGLTLLAVTPPDEALEH